MTRDEALRSAESRPLRPEDVEALPENRRSIPMSREIALLLCVHLGVRIATADADTLEDRFLIYRDKAGPWCSTRGREMLRTFAEQNRGSR